MLTGYDLRISGKVPRFTIEIDRLAWISMNAVIDESVLQQIRILIVDQAQASSSMDPLAEAFKVFGGSLAGSLGLGIIATGILMALVCLVYRPRTLRGALWVPFFGIFGGTPTLYLHTRPPSFLGFRTKARGSK